jgi:type III secretion protein D
MFELRVMSGLHRGAALPLVGEHWLVGASEEADLALYDPGIQARHVGLRCVDGHWSVEAEDGLLCDEQGQRQALIATLQPGVPFAVGGIWLCVTAADQPWPEEAVDAAPETIIDETAAPRSTPRPSLAKRLGIAAAVITLAGSAWALSTPGADPVRLDRPADISQRQVLETTFEVRRELLRMLRERELSGLIELREREGRVVLSGAVPKDRLPVVARMIERFVERFDTSIAITDALQEQRDELPFKIVQIVGGKQGHVVTADGRRLFLGDEIDGLRLTAIDNSKVRFEGEQRYEVTW